MKNRYKLISVFIWESVWYLEARIIPFNCIRETLIPGKGECFVNVVMSSHAACVQATGTYLGSPVTSVSRYCSAKWNKRDSRRSLKLQSDR